MAEIERVSEFRMLPFAVAGSDVLEEARLLDAKFALDFARAALGLRSTCR